MSDRLWEMALEQRDQARAVCGEWQARSVALDLELAQVKAELAKAKNNIAFMADEWKRERGLLMAERDGLEQERYDVRMKLAEVGTERDTAIRERDEARNELEAHDLTKHIADRIIEAGDSKAQDDLDTALRHLQAVLAETGEYADVEYDARAFLLSMREKADQ